MRKKKKEIHNRAVIDKLLNTCPVGRLGTIGKDGYPRIKPLNFVYLDGTIYFHSAKEGEKIDDINRDIQRQGQSDLGRLSCRKTIVRQHNQQINVRILRRFPVGIGTKQNDAVRLELRGNAPDPIPYLLHRHQGLRRNHEMHRRVGITALWLLP